jgi:photosystem II stability/assembly factor-like uncharacterized protein
MPRLLKLICLLYCFGIYTCEAQWEQCNKGLNDLSITCIIGNGDKTYLGTSDGLYCSTDNGDSWIAKNNGLTESTISSLAANGQFIYLGTRNGNFFISNDDANTWESKSNGLSHSSVWSIAVKGNYVYLGTRDSGIFVSSDHGDTWLRKNKELIYVRSLVASDKVAIAGTYNSGVYLTSDNGITWIERNNGLNDIDVRCMAFNGKDLFVGTSALGVFHSTDFGNLWSNELIGASIYGSVWAFLLYDNYIFLGSFDRGFYYSKDNGTSWSERNQGLIDTSVTLLAQSNGYIFSANSNMIYRAKLSDLGIVDVVDNTNKGIRVYPNPAEDYIEIYFGSNIETLPTCDIRIFNNLGECKLIIEHSRECLIRIDISSLLRGIYFVKIGDKTKKFSKI